LIRTLEAKFQRNLNDSGAGTDAKDATEVARSQDPSSDGLDIAACGKHRADVANGVIAVCELDGGPRYLSNLGVEILSTGERRFIVSYGDLVSTVGP
jgi:hypothetical protein